MKTTKRLICWLFGCARVDVGLRLARTGMVVREQHCSRCRRTRFVPGSLIDASIFWLQQSQTSQRVLTGSAQNAPTEEVPH